MFNGKIHYKWQFSIAMLNYQRISWNIMVSLHHQVSFRLRIVVFGGLFHPDMGCKLLGEHGVASIFGHSHTNQVSIRYPEDWCGLLKILVRFTKDRLTTGLFSRVLIRDSHTRLKHCHLKWLPDERPMKWHDPRYTIWLFNIAMENSNHKWRYLWENHLFLWAIYTMAAMLVITRR